MYVTPDSQEYRRKHSELGKLIVRRTRFKARSYPERAPTPGFPGSPPIRLQKRLLEGAGPVGRRRAECRSRGRVRTSGSDPGLGRRGPPRVKWNPSGELFFHWARRMVWNGRSTGLSSHPAGVRADDRTRTDNLLLTRQLLYQLSYVSEGCFVPNLREFSVLCIPVGQAGRWGISPGEPIRSTVRPGRPGTCSEAEGFSGLSSRPH